jgi:hypothetical protein
MNLPFISDLETEDFIFWGVVSVAVIAALIVIYVIVGENNGRRGEYRAASKQLLTHCQRTGVSTDHNGRGTRLVYDCPDSAMDEYLNQIRKIK